LSLEKEVEEMLSDLMRKEGWTRSYTLSILRSKFESEERYQEVEYVNSLMKKEEQDMEEEEEGKKISDSQFQKDY
jgi:hypothetical protein